MDYLISVSFGELTLKGDNRKDFENRIIRKIKKAIADFEVEEFYNNFYEDDGLDEEYDYYDNKYKETIDKNKNI